MTSKQAYQALLDGVFGAGAVVADAADDASNVITGAVRYNLAEGRFAFFARQLEDRIRRLNEKFPGGHSRDEVIGKISRLASERNYPGTLAELAVYDYFAALARVEAEVKVPAARTLASLLPNRQESSFDLCLPEFGDLLFDAKSFSDVLSGVVDNIKSRAMPLAGVYRIDASYPYDLPHESVSSQFGQIVAGLKAAATAKKKGYQHEGLPDLRFRFETDPPPRITNTEHTYSPKRLLGEMRYFVLNHFDQFLREEPNLLVYVVHPWFNLIQCPFTRNVEFYHSYCRQVFLDLAGDQTTLGIAVPKKAPGVSITVAETVRKLGAIMFLEDRTVEPPKDHQPERTLDAVRGWLFVNRNADPRNDVTGVAERLGRLADERGLRLRVERP